MESDHNSPLSAIGLQICLGGFALLWLAGCAFPPTKNLPPATLVLDETVEPSDAPTVPIATLSEAVPPETPEQGRLLSHPSAEFETEQEQLSLPAGTISYPEGWFVAQSGAQTIISNQERSIEYAFPTGEETLILFSQGIVSTKSQTALALNRRVLGSIISERGRSLREWSQPMPLALGGTTDAAQSISKINIEGTPYLFVITTIVTPHEDLIAIGILEDQDDEVARARLAQIKTIINSFQYSANRTVLPPAPIERSDLIVRILGENQSLSRASVNEVEGVLSVGEPAAGVIREYGTQAWRIIGKSGEIYAVDVSPLSPDMDIQLDVLDIAQRSILASPPSNRFFIDEPEKIASIIIPEDGDYTLVVNTADLSGGLYEVVLSRAGGIQPPTSPTEGGIHYGEIYTATLSTKVEKSWVMLGHAGRFIDVDVASDAGNDMLVEFVSPDGAPIDLPEPFRDNGIIQYKGIDLPQTGLYSLILKSDPPKPDTISLLVNDSFRDRNGVLLLNEVGTPQKFIGGDSGYVLRDHERLKVGFYDPIQRKVVHAIEVAVPTTLVIEALPQLPNVDVAISVFDRDGNRIANMDNSFGGVMESLSVDFGPDELTESFKGFLEIRELSGTLGSVNVNLMVKPAE